MLPRKSSHNTHNTPWTNMLLGIITIFPPFIVINAYGCQPLSYLGMKNQILEATAQINIISPAKNLNVWGPACFPVLIKGGSITSAEILNCPNYHKKSWRRIQDCWVPLKIDCYCVCGHKSACLPWGKIFRASSVGLRLLHCSHFKIFLL